VIRAVLNVLRFVLLLLVVRFVVRTVARAFGAGRERPRTPPSPGRAQVHPPEDLVLDPVCRTHVPRSRALVARVGGREEHFCSPACRDKALEQVARAS
jgi:YHS domain-containing protein